MDQTFTEERKDIIKKAGFEAKIAYFTFAFLVVLIGIMTYWAILPVDVLKINKLPVPVTVPENIKSGRILMLKFDYCKYTGSKGLVERTLVSDRNVITLPSYEDTSPAGCNKADVPTVLPYTIIEQEYNIHYKITYQVNPLREVVEEFDSEKFLLIPVDVPIDGTQTD